MVREQDHPITLFIALVSHHCCNKSPQLSGLTTPICCLTVQSRPHRLKPRREPLRSSGGSRGESCPYLFQLLEAIKLLACGAPPPFCTFKASKDGSTPSHITSLDLLHLPPPLIRTLVRTRAPPGESRTASLS